MPNPNHINPDHFLETAAGRVDSAERGKAAWEQAYAALERQLQCLGGKGTLYVVCGLQGAGKSRWVKQNAAALGAQAVFLDAALPSVRHRSRALGLAAQTATPAVAVWLDAPLEVALRRNAARPVDQRVDEAIVRHVHEQLHAPSEAEGFARVIHVDASAEQPAPIDYLHPDLPAGLRTVRMPVVDATDAALRGYGHLVDDPAHAEIEIVRWPARGTRPIDAGTGDQGGTTEGVFVSEWQGDVLYGRNEAVGGHYILAYARPPEHARTDHAEPPSRMLLWHANYHPDGGQLFFPLDRRPFFVPLALPGDDVTPERFVCFRFDGRQGLCIHPDIWHEGVFGLAGTQRFFDRQGAVHARVSVDFAREFDCLLEAPIDP